jgi:hypothetical protein
MNVDELMEQRLSIEELNEKRKEILRNILEAIRYRDEVRRIELEKEYFVVYAKIKKLSKTHNEKDYKNMDETLEEKLLNDRIYTRILKEMRNRNNERACTSNYEYMAKTPYVFKHSSVLSPKLEEKTYPSLFNKYKSVEHSCVSDYKYQPSTHIKNIRFKKELLEYLLDKQKYNILLMIGYEGFEILYRNHKYEILFMDKSGSEFLFNRRWHCLTTFDSGKDFLLNNEEYLYKLIEFKEGIKLLFDNNKYEPLLESSKWRKHLLGKGKYSILARNPEGRKLLIENHKCKYILSTQEGRDQFLKSIKNISQETYILLCISCIEYGDVQSFEILKNTKLMHPSKDVITLLENHNIDEKRDICNLFYPFLNVNTQRILRIHNFKKFCESLSSHKMCNQVIVFDNLMKFISEFL